MSNRFRGSCQERALSPECQDRVLSIMEPFMHVGFLDKVRAGRSSNLNESLRKLFWSFVSKTTAFDLCAFGNKSRSN